MAMPVSYLGHLLSFHISVDDVVYVNVARPFTTPSGIWISVGGSGFCSEGMEGELIGAGEGPPGGNGCFRGRRGSEDRNQHGHQSIGSQADLNVRVSCYSIRMPLYDNGERLRPMDTLALEPRPQRSGSIRLLDGHTGEVEY